MYINLSSKYDITPFIAFIYTNVMFLLQVGALWTTDKKARDRFAIEIRNVVPGIHIQDKQTYPQNNRWISSFSTRLRTRPYSQVPGR